MQAGVFSAQDYEKQGSAMPQKAFSPTAGEAARPFSFIDAPLADIHEHCLGGTLDQPLPSPLLPGAPESPFLCVPLSVSHCFCPWILMKHRTFFNDSSQIFPLLFFLFCSNTRLWLDCVGSRGRCSPLLAPLSTLVCFFPQVPLGACFPSLPHSCLIKCLS